MNPIQARAEIARLGLRLTRRGAAWRISGPGIDVLVASLSALHESDLRPVVHRLNERNQTRTTENL